MGFIFGLITGGLLVFILCALAVGKEYDEELEIGEDYDISN